MTKSMRVISYVVVLGMSGGCGGHLKTAHVGGASPTAQRPMNRAEKELLMIIAVHGDVIVTVTDPVGRHGNATGEGSTIPRYTAGEEHEVTSVADSAGYPDFWEAEIENAPGGRYRLDIAAQSTTRADVDVSIRPYEGNGCGASASDSLKGGETKLVEFDYGPLDDRADCELRFVGKR